MKKNFEIKSEDSRTLRKRRTPTNNIKRVLSKGSGRPSINISLKKADHDGIRLNRFIANAGICSRREADEYISTGLIKVNDKLVTELGTKINETDIVKFNGEIIKTERKVYILLNKPKDYITTVDDPHASKTVLDLIKGACRERVYPVGRLDRMSTGLLLITNDGEITKQLTHPAFNKKKIYHVQLNKSLKSRDFLKISQGIELEDGFIKPDSINYVNEEDKTEIGIEIHSGKNRIVRRIFEHLEYTVQKLDRVYYAGLTKKNLPRGKWRFLSNSEISIIKTGRYL
jgi:23S rRNA pseudouridine2605 synthase